MKWNLDSLFKGGSSSSEFSRFLVKIGKEISQINNLLLNTNELLIQAILFLQKVNAKLDEADSFVGCLNAQDVHDSEAKRLKGCVQELKAAFQISSDTIFQKISSLSDKSFKTLIEDERIRPIAYPLLEKRREASDNLPNGQETLVTELSVDGFHAWQQMYITCVNQMKIRCTIDGKKEVLSIGQASNHLSHPDNATRHRVFGQWEQAFTDQEDVLATVLNHLAGFRLKVYQKKGWESILKRPLEMNRISEKTLNTMWSVIEANKAPFIDYFKTKARLLGVSKLSWCDIIAPIGKKKLPISYDKGQKLILDAFGRVSPTMAAFAKKTFNLHWNEVENRLGKSPGGFCTGFPISKQSRVFMTYSNSKESLAVLAHELGHAYHNEVIFPLPPLAQHFPMTLAETASTFAEHVLSYTLLENAKTKEERLAILDDRIQRSTTFFMNIHCRYLFELAFYKERLDGFVSAKRLNQLMEESQQQAFGNSLKEYHPHFWASKQHFYISEMPCYHFPYTVGYLFSLGLYAHYQKNKSNFDSIYRLLLMDTGCMSVEDLASKHLGIDLTKPMFWQAAMDVAIHDYRAMSDET